MTTTRRTSARVLGALAAALLATTALVHGAGALEQESMTVPGRATVEHEYPPIPANDPATVTVDHTLITPSECRDLPSCALVPIDIEIPDLDPGDDFYVVLTMSWEVTDVSDNNVQPVKSNDLDTFLYDDGQTDKAEGGDGSTYTEIGSSASGDMPEVIKAFEPKLGRYNLVVINFAGGNTGWTLKAESLVGEFDKPFEQLAPGPNGGTNNVNNKPTTTTTTRPPATTTSTVTVPEGVVIPDDDFEGGAFEPTNDFENQLAGDFDLEDLDEIEAINAELEANRAANTAGSPSPLLVVLWMVVFPGALAAGGFLLLKRRGRGRRSNPAAAA